MRGLIVLILLFWVLPAVIKKLKGKGESTQKKNSTAARPTTAPRRTPSVELHRPAPSMQRRTPSVTHSAQRDFSAPDAPCIVCEQTGEDHFQRDKARRIAQLDIWLKNGIIGREEYRVLKDRYERGI